MISSEQRLIEDPASTRRPNVPFTRSVIGDEARAAVAEVLASGWITTGPQVREFENEFASYVGARHAVAVSSCTAAIELALRALNLPMGARVLTSTNTFCGAAGAIIHAGLVPVLADVDPSTAMPNAETVVRAVAAVGGVSAMLVIHLGGHPADVAGLSAAAGLSLDMVIEDAAHALGTFVGDRAVGSISRATCFSFYATKNLQIGEGGMVTTDDSELAHTLRQSRLHGMSADAWRRYSPGAGWRYDVQVDGLKANMTDVQAAIGRSQLQNFGQMQMRRREVADRYDAHLRLIPQLSPPPRPALGRHAWHLYAVRVRPDFRLSRDQLIAALTQRGIGSSVHFIPIHQLTWYGQRCPGPEDGFPGAESVFAETISLPFDHVMSDDDVDTVCLALADLAISA